MSCPGRCRGAHPLVMVSPEYPVADTGYQVGFWVRRIFGLTQHSHFLLSSLLEIHFCALIVTSEAVTGGLSVGGKVFECFFTHVGRETGRRFGKNSLKCHLLF